MRKSWRNTTVLLFVLAVVAGGLYGTHIQAMTDEARSSLRLYTELITAAHQHYGDEVTYQDLVYASINGMTRTLDPHTNFLPPRAYDDMRDRQRSHFYGLGIMVGIRNGRVTVITPIEGGPAARLGIQAGDIIDTIGGESTESITLDEAVSKLKGPKGTEVDITVLRGGVDEPLAMSVTRAEIPQTTVRYAYMLTPETGYLRITDFNRSTGSEVADTLDKLKEQGMQQLLIDLRNNGGGLLDQAIEVSEQFVPEGTKIVETRGRTRNSFQAFYAGENYEDLDLPVVVLVNSGTASAAEILAGAIQDHDVGVITGTRTWGKGLVQTVYSLSYGAGLALTTARYYTPSGRLIQRDYTSFYDYYAYDGGAPEEEAGETEAANEAASGTSPEITRENLELGEDVEVFATDLGRSVYAGGGITPDVSVRSQTIPRFGQRLLINNAFFNFGIDYQGKKPVRNEAWQPNGGTLNAFRDWVVSEEIATAEEWDEAMQEPKNRDYAMRQIRAEVFNAAFGQDAWHRALAEGDNQIQTALGLFDEAGDLLTRRHQLREERAQLAEKQAVEKPN